MNSPLTRRDFMGAAAAALSSSLLPQVPGARRAWRAALPALEDAPPGIDDALLEVTVAKLHALYSAGTYTATDVTRWYLARVARYNGVYRAVSYVDEEGALLTAGALDAAARRDRTVVQRSALWGVPIVIKANTSIHGLVTSTGWWGYVLPGEKLVAPRDATIVSKLRAAGAIILGQTNMPDFAASDTTFSTAYGRTGNAYNVRCSPGGSSGGSVTAVTANLCVLATGTDTGNSIRMPAGTSSVVGLLPTRGLVSIAGIHPLDWLRDDTGPITRDVTDAVRTLDVMMGADPADFRTRDSAAHAQPGPYTGYLSADALRGKRFGVPAFMMNEATPNASPTEGTPLHPVTRARFMKSLEGIRAAGGTVVFDPSILPESFPRLVREIDTGVYRPQGVEAFLRDYGPPEYHSMEEYAQVVGTLLPDFLRGVGREHGASATPEAVPPLASDPQAEKRFWGPQRRALAAFDDTLERFHLDGFVYPSAQMPPNDELQDLAEGHRSRGPHSDTAWVNPIGVPAIVVPGGFYADGLPFGLEISTRRWKDGDLAGWAFAYQEATRYRKPPALITAR